jgi:hypothetical protein
MYHIPMLITFLSAMGPLLPELAKAKNNLDVDMAKPKNNPDVDILAKYLRYTLPELFSLLLKSKEEQLAAQRLHQIQVSATLCRE